MSGQRVGYARVSTVDQNTGRQHEALEKENLDRVFEDKVSGKSTDRPQLHAMLAHVREGDTVVVYSMDRLARNLTDLRKLVDDLTARCVEVRFVKESLTFTHGKPGSTARLMLNIMGSVAEFEREMMLERQREGIQLAKREGKYTGGKAKLSAERAADLREKANVAGVNRAALAREFGISRAALYVYLEKAKAS
ncbi:MAG TPA: recombinase family protein [Edaphobacter sp.]|nr:recombinase family protein [Edaphobacter sp.]